jgi:hypothetical protein
MGSRKVFRRRIRLQDDGVDVVADVNVVSNVNVGGGRSDTKTSSRARSVAGAVPPPSEEHDTSTPDEGGDGDG